MKIRRNDLGCYLLKVIGNSKKWWIIEKKRLEIIGINITK
jgi:hypothetical protein